MTEKELERYEHYYCLGDRHAMIREIRRCWARIAELERQLALSDRISATAMRALQDAVE